ncbi:RILP-like protein homolog [Trichonephila clavipes]|nr:RILP-like protein homolog [Trichonephila clavipes]
MDKHVDSQIFVGDVYDLAAEIGKEFEKLIDICGTDTIRELMTKVIVTLEYLESSTVIVDRLQSELYDIKAKVQQLEYEKLERAEFRSKLDQELEIIEENWRKETSHLNSLVVKLQEENKRLSTIISEKDKHTPSDCKAFLSDEELVVVQKLKELTEQHRGQLIQKDKELLEKTNESEKLPSKKLISIILWLGFMVPYRGLMNVISDKESGDSFADTTPLAHADASRDVFPRGEKAFQIKSVPDVVKAEILLNILGERMNNLLTYVSQEDLSNYVKIKELILREFEPTPQECLSNFKKACKLPSKNYVQFASRLSATFDYYCQLRKVNEFRSFCDLIISDKIFETLDRDTMNLFQASTAWEGK